MPDDPTAIRVDQFLPHPPAKVWRALTTPGLMAAWLMPNDFRPVRGHRFTLSGRPVPATGFSGTVACEVLAIEPPRMLRISWADAAAPRDGHATEVTWTLHPEGRGTRLLLEHSGFDPDDPVQQLSRHVMGGGWRSRVLRRLAELLDDAPDPSCSEEENPVSDVAARYAALADAFAARIAATPADRWDDPSPCRGWTARDVVAHVVNGHRGIVAMATGTPPAAGHGVHVGPMAQAPLVEPGADLAAAFRACRDALLAVLADPALATRVLRGPLGPVPFERTVDVIGALELLGHTWDLARATGGDDRLDPEAVARTHAALLPHAAALRSTGAFDIALPAPRGADPQTAFLRFTGRPA